MVSSLTHGAMLALREPRPNFTHAVSPNWVRTAGSQSIQASSLCLVLLTPPTGRFGSVGAGPHRRLSATSRRSPLNVKVTPKRPFASGRAKLVRDAIPYPRSSGSVKY